MPQPLPPAAPFRRNPPGHRRSRVRGAADPEDDRRPTEKRFATIDHLEFHFARLGRETCEPWTLTAPEWHAQRALCSLATGMDRDGRCPERCRDGCPYLAAVRRTAPQLTAEPWWRAWREAQTTGGVLPQPAIRLAKRSNR